MYKSFIHSWNQFSDKSSKASSGFVQLYSTSLTRSETFRAKWIIQFYMSFHFLFLGENTLCQLFPTFLLHILKRRLPTGDIPLRWRRPGIVNFLQCSARRSGLGKWWRRVFSDRNIFILPTTLWSRSTTAQLLSASSLVFLVFALLRKNG